jgi:hypothetical protein
MYGSGNQLHGSNYVIRWKVVYCNDLVVVVHVLFCVPHFRKLPNLVDDTTVFGQT